MIEILVKGKTGVGKSIIATSLLNRATEGGFRTEISDHELFTSDSGFEKHLKIVRKHHKDVEVSIIVIDDGERNLRVDFGGRVPYELASVLFPG